MDHLHVRKAKSRFSAASMKKIAAATKLRISSTMRSAVVIGAGVAVGSVLADAPRRDLAFPGMDTGSLLCFTIHIS